MSLAVSELPSIEPLLVSYSPLAHAFRRPLLRNWYTCRRHYPRKKSAFCTGPEVLFFLSSSAGHFGRKNRLRTYIIREKLISR